MEWKPLPTACTDEDGTLFVTQKKSNNRWQWQSFVSQLNHVCRILKCEGDKLPQPWSPKINLPYEMVIMLIKA